MAFDKPYDIDPNPAGDTVKESIVNTDLNVDDIYSNLNVLLAQIALLPGTPTETLDWLLTVDGTGSGLDADTLDGFHASHFAIGSHDHPLATASIPGFLAPIDKQKIDGIASGAEVNVQADWNQTDSSDDSFLRNKPKILEIEGSPQSGEVTVFTGPTSIHGSNAQEMQNLLGYFTSAEFIAQTAGIADAGKPIVLGADGLIHPTMIPAVPAQAIWGGITGTLANQTDLQAALDAKEFALGNPANDGHILSSTVAGVRSWIPAPSGGGDAVWGSITGTLSDQDDLQNALDAKSDTGHNHDGSYFLETEFLETSAGIGDAGKPIVLNSQGQIDASMLDVSVFHYIGSFTPVAGTEYPDPAGEDFGAFWVVQGVDAGTGYTFTGGDLAGLTVDNGDFMVWASAGWSIMAGEMNPMLYYKLDGTQALTHPFAGGGQQLKSIADGTDGTDAVTVSQLAGKEDGLGNPANDGEILSSTAAGARSWVPMPDLSIDWGDIGGTLANQTDLQDALDLKSDSGHNHDGVYLAIAAKAADSELLDGLEAAAFELALGNPTVDNQILVSLTNGTRGWATLPVTQWGGIEGTLASQTDLQSALDGKAASGHNHDADYLAIGGTAVDSAQLGGFDAVHYQGKVFTNLTDQDPNTTGLHLMLTNHANAPQDVPGAFWYIQTFYYDQPHLNRSQIAISYDYEGRIAVRNFASNAWTDWVYCQNSGLEDEIDQLKQRVTALGG